MNKIIFALPLLSTLSFAQLIDGRQSDVPPNSVAMGTDTTGNYVADITAGNGISTTGASTGENISHTISVNQDFNFTFTGAVTFTPAGSDDLLFNIDAGSEFNIVGASGEDTTIALTTPDVAGNCYMRFQNSADDDNTWVMGRQHDGIFKIGRNAAQPETSGTTYLQIGTDGSWQQPVMLAVKPTCNSGSAGTEIMYTKGSGGTEAKSKCICEEVAGVYNWAAATATGDCT